MSLVVDEEDSFSGDWIPPAARAAARQSAQRRSLSSTSSQQSLSGTDPAELAADGSQRTSSSVTSSQTFGAAQVGSTSASRSSSSSSLQSQGPNEEVEEDVGQPASQTCEVFLWRPGQGKTTTRKPMLPKSAPRTSPTSPSFSSHLQQPPGNRTTAMSIGAQAAFNNPSEAAHMPSASTLTTIREPCVQCGQLEENLRTQRRHFENEVQQLSSTVERLRLSSSEIEGQREELRQRIREVEEELQLKSQAVERLEEMRNGLQEECQRQLQEKEDELDGLRQQIVAKENSLKQSQDEREHLRAQLVSSQEDNAELSKKADTAKSDLKLLRNEWEELLAAKRNLEELLVAKQNLEEQLQDTEGQAEENVRVEKAAYNGRQSRLQQEHTLVSQQALLKQLLDCQDVIQNGRQPTAEELQQLKETIFSLQAEPESLWHKKGMGNLPGEDRKKTTKSVRFADGDPEIVTSEGNRAELDYSVNSTASQTPTQGHLRQPMACQVPTQRHSSQPMASQGQTQGHSLLPMSNQASAYAQGHQLHMHYGSSTTGQLQYGPTSLPVNTGRDFRGMDSYHSYSRTAMMTSHTPADAEPDMYGQSPQVSLDTYPQPHYTADRVSPGSLPLSSQPQNLPKASHPLYPNQLERSFPGSYPSSSSDSSSMSTQGGMTDKTSQFLPLSSPTTQQARPANMTSSPEPRQQLPGCKFEEEEEVFVSVGLEGQLLPGTIRYIGPLKGKKASRDIIVGVELDEEMVGAGSGTIEGLLYFECDPGKGMFVPVDKIVGMYD